MNSNHILLSFLAVYSFNHKRNIKHVCTEQILSGREMISHQIVQCGFNYH